MQQKSTQNLKKFITEFKEALRSTNAGHSLSNFSRSEVFNEVSQFLKNIGDEDEKRLTNHQKEGIAEINQLFNRMPEDIWNNMSATGYLRNLKNKISGVCVSIKEQIPPTSKSPLTEEKNPNENMQGTATLLSREVNNQSNQRSPSLFDALLEDVIDQSIASFSSQNQKKFEEIQTYLLSIKDSQDTQISAIDRKMSESKNSQARFAQELKSTLSDINQRQTDLVEEFDKLKNEYKKNADKEKARAEKAIQKANKDHEQFKSKLRQQLNDLFNDVRDSEIKEQIKAGDIEFSLAIIENTLQAIDILIEYDILK